MICQRFYFIVVSLAVVLASAEKKCGCVGDLTFNKRISPIDLNYSSNPSCKKKTGKLGQGIYTIVQNLVTLQHVCGYNYA